MLRRSARSRRPPTHRTVYGETPSSSTTSLWSSDRIADVVARATGSLRRRELPSAASVWPLPRFPQEDSDWRKLFTECKELGALMQMAYTDQPLASDRPMRSLRAAPRSHPRTG